MKIAEKNISTGEQPFGSVIVKNGKIVAQGANCIAAHNDPTAHAEIEAIRNAGKVLNTFDLSGCEIYASCEPCPMCLSAIYWAKINKIYYASTKEDAGNNGFDDSFLYQQIALNPGQRSVSTVQLLREESLNAFRLYKEKNSQIKI